MIFSVVWTNTFKKDYKRAQKRGLDISLLNNIILDLSKDVKFPAKNKDHQLSGKLARFRECHIQPDWLLIYEKSAEKLILTLTATGTHSDLFNN